ncbi:MULTISPECIES: hypothetical protein [Pseudarthrobacter]|uniref:Uncharacterized protein n=1 Tax=Pseudarthrobacter polychromogenes TaxID=1676 RepID=A0ABQ1XAJ5_9MICC|nr:hypothetical protein [Pseudarthrobacter polychromogenes]GGG86938.1 hypothetical protein GCM10011577_06210 [Pseudarthrobacter polychromogenes]
MSAVVVAIWSLVAAAGAALASSAPYGAVGHGGQYLAGHVLLGLGLGQLLAAVVRFAVRRMVAGAARTAPAPLAAVPALQTAAAPAGDRIAGDVAAVTVLYPRPAAVVPLRGRHAA